VSLMVIVLPIRLGERGLSGPSQDEPRIDAIDGAKGVRRSFLTRRRPHTRSLSKRTLVLSARWHAHFCTAGSQSSYVWGGSASLDDIC